MTTARLEAFSDAVIAILMTIMVLELGIPREPNLEALRPLVPVFLAYALSFVNLGIYWNNHHHMLVVVERVNGKILWANMHLLFWLSLFPFVTGWMGETEFDTLPVIAYGLAALAARSLTTSFGRRSSPTKEKTRSWPPHSDAISKAKLRPCYTWQAS